MWLSGTLVEDPCNEIEYLKRFLFLLESRIREVKQCPSLTASFREKEKEITEKEKK
jgi:hypothetical protein